MEIGIRLRTVLAGTALSAALVLAAGGSLAAPVEAVGNAAGGPARSTAGAYLAGVVASVHQDVGRAADYLTQALGAGLNQPRLMRRALMVLIQAGRTDAAVPLADDLHEMAPGDPMPTVTLISEAFKTEDYDAALALIDGTALEGLPTVLKPVLQAWARAGAGDVPAGLAVLDELAANETFRPVGTVHKALLLDWSGALAAAEEAYTAIDDSGMTLTVARAYGSLLERQGRTEDARALYQRFATGHGEELHMQDLAAYLDRNETPPPSIARPADGVTEAFFQVASFADQQGLTDVALTFSRLALYLAPEHRLARLKLGEVLADVGQYAPALAVLRGLPDVGAIGWAARLQEAEVLESDGRIEEAVAQLQSLADREPGRPEALIALGDLYRRDSRFDAAIDAYDQAEARDGPRLSENWGFLYKRGIALERAKRWDRAERDLTRAITLNPDQADMLNYLGYSWVDRGKNLDEAEELIRRANEMEPDSGYIIDSLGWVYYHTGRYEEAVQQLEQAAELMPEDTVVNDHLGDAYWQVGRRREAVYQWQRALRTAETEDETAKLQRKVEHGLEPAAPDGTPPPPAADDQQPAGPDNVGP